MTTERNRAQKRGHGIRIVQIPGMSLGTHERMFGSVGVFWVPQMVFSSLSC